MTDPNIIEAINEVGMEISELRGCLYVVIFCLGGILAMLIFWKK